MPTELAHNLKETPQAVLVCQQRWHGASHNPFAVHVYMHIYIYLRIINRLTIVIQKIMNKYSALREYSIC